MKYFTFYLHMLFCLSLFFTFFSKNIEQTTKKEAWVTIFVHGIMSIQPYLSPGLICKLFNDSIENTLYADVVCAIRKNTLFSCNQLMQGVGLHQIDIQKKERYTASQALALLYNEVLAQENSHEKNIFYTFGWSGLLSKTARQKAAKQLFVELEAEIKKLKKIGYFPKIRLIGYSHGANVCLNLAAVKNEYKKKYFSIDELILLGCPIQVDNDFLVNDSLFKNVYNFYSKKDRIQKRDCFSSKAFSSDRRFCKRARYGVSRKVTQAQIKITRIKPKIKNNRKTNIISRTKYAKSRSYFRILRDESPGHMELWFFGWTPRHYRKKFILYPYPVLLFLPIIIKGLQKSNIQHNGACHEIIVDIRPDHEIIIVKNNTNEYTQTFNFKKLCTIFAPISTRAKPKKYTKEMVAHHISYHKQKIRNERLRNGMADGRAKRMRK